VNFLMAVAWGSLGTNSLTNSIIPDG
jgi:hypothetical protein